MKNIFLLIYLNENFGSLSEITTITLNKGSQIMMRKGILIATACCTIFNLANACEAAEQSHLEICQKNLWHNCFGAATDSAGEYVGEFANGMFNGQGIYTFADGEEYVGEFKNNKYNGYGILRFSNGEKYVGQFKDKMRNGQGTYTFPNGEKYVGEFKDNEYCGNGTYTFSDGQQYVGEYKDSMRHGQGTFYDSSGGELLSGQWERGKFRYYNLIFKYPQANEIS